MFGEDSKKTVVLLEGSRKYFGTDFHVDGPATANILL